MPPASSPADPNSSSAAPWPAAAPLTLADWRAAALADLGQPAVLAQRLTARLSALREPAGDPAWITLAPPDHFAEQLRQLADRAAALAADPAAMLREMPLFGVPFAVKDNIDVAGLPTTAACPAFAHTATRSATAVERLLVAGAVCLGKTNLDQFATGLVGTRSPYGRPASTFAADRVSGGSSSGSAVTVARGDVAFALGTDTAGSGRVPAGFNNIVGLKPTPGRASTRGVVPACRSLDCISVFALTVADAAQVLAVIEGADAGDAYSRFVPGPAHFSLTSTSLTSTSSASADSASAASASASAAPASAPALRVGIPAAPHFGSTPGYAAAWQVALQQLEAQGHRAVAVDFAPLHAVAGLLYGGPWVAERHAAVADLLLRDPSAFDATVRGVIESAIGFSATDAFRAQYRLREAQRATASLWQGVDVLMVPTAPAHPSFAEVDAQPVSANAQLGHYTNFVNLLGWCALALPAGFTVAGLPFGVTFIAPADHDAALARFGAGWQGRLALPLGASGRAWPGVDAPAEPAASFAWPASAPTLPIAVVGAHLSGLPLNGQLTERGATLRGPTLTAPHYRLYALPGTTPPKPGMQRVAEGGASLVVEVWDMPLAAVGSFLALIPPPLGLGSVELADGSRVYGFVCESHALAGARDITAFGGWRAFLQS